MRPEYVKQEHLDFLDQLRESGVTNMLGAAPYLVKHMGLDKTTARKVLSYWMETFGKEYR